MLTADQRQTRQRRRSSSPIWRLPSGSECCANQDSLHFRQRRNTGLSGKLTSGPPHFGQRCAAGNVPAVLMGAGSKDLG